MTIPLIILAALLPQDLIAQSGNSFNTVPEKSVRFANEKYEKLNAAVTKQTLRLLERSQCCEAKLQKKLEGIDSTKAAVLFADAQARYQSLAQKLRAVANPNVTSPCANTYPALTACRPLLSSWGSGAVTCGKRKYSKTTLREETKI